MLSARSLTSWSVTLLLRLRTCFSSGWIRLRDRRNSELSGRRPAVGPCLRAGGGVGRFVLRTASLNAAFVCWSIMLGMVGADQFKAELSDEGGSFRLGAEG